MTRRFVLIHGSWHGGWCWHKVAPLLRAHGSVEVINLPGRGRDPAFGPTVTLRTMRAAVRKLIGHGERVTLVAHSRSGVIATAVAEAFPQLVERVVYLAAFMLPSGERAADWFARDRDSLLRGHVKASVFTLSDRLDPSIWREGLYHDCSEADVELASSLLCAEPSWTALTRVVHTPARFGSVPRSYLRLLQDRAVSLATQDRLIDASPPERVESIDASHSAYFSRPDALARAIVTVSS